MFLLVVSSIAQVVAEYQRRWRNANATEWPELATWYQDQLKLVNKPSASSADLNLEYSKKLNELTAKGWNQEEYQKILDWYQSESNKLKTTGVLFFSHFCLFSEPSTMAELLEEYKKRLIEMNEQGYNAEKQQELVKWYQAQTTRINQINTDTSGPSIPVYNTVFSFLSSYKSVSIGCSRIEKEY